jgi:dTDP-4-dehydrorhamnose 3,5-epimerase
MGLSKLEDIIVTPLKRIPTLGGDVLKILTIKDPGYVSFGEAYISIIKSGEIKAWKRHREMTLNLVVPSGEIRIVFFASDSERETIFRVEEIGERNYSRITVPPGIWFGFQGIHAEPSLLLNLASIPHDPNESDRLDISEIKFNW